MDELLFLAGFLGSCLLVTSTTDMDTWAAVHYQGRVLRPANYASAKLREDNEHKLVLVREFAASCGLVIKFP